MASDPVPVAADGLIARTVKLFLTGNLSVMLIVLALLAGAVALLVTPREEDPQIVVPMADVMISVPGASASEVERQVATRLEKLLYQIDGVEYVYSMSTANQAIVTVRFYVGEDREDSLIKLHNKIAMSQDVVPANVSGWVVKPVEIDDVPIVGITLYATDEHYSDADLRRIAEELDIRLQAVENTGRTLVVGGRELRVRVQIDPEKLAGRGLTVMHIENALRGANVMSPAGAFDELNQSILVDVGPPLRHVRDVADLVIGVSHDNGSQPVYLREVAQVELAPSEPETYTHIGLTGEGGPSPLYPAVTIAVAKKKGTNAVWVSRDVQEKMNELAPLVLPAGVEYRITRDYGETANGKVNELVESLAVAIVIVIAMIALTLGWREGIVVATAVPITFALTLLVNYLTGYTINRVTLFALILALGLVVDDPIVDVENIHRHFKLRKERPLNAVLTAVNEVRPPIILATLAVIVSFIPMFFITGMMGPYMRPMALNVPLAMLMSLVVAFTITPWMTYHMLKGVHEKADAHGPASDDAIHTDTDDSDVLHRTLTYRVYSRIVEPFLMRRSLAWLLVLVMVVLFALSCLLAVLQQVPLKMLPYDNKNELQVVVDMPEGTTLESTAAATHELARYLQAVHEVTDVSTYVGTSSAMDFNGMVRHYYLRNQPHMADIRVNLLDKDDRQQQSHEIALRLRNDLEAIAARHSANIKIVELPPGPPVISTITVEVYGQPYHEYDQLTSAADVIAERFRQEPGVVDVDTTGEASQVRYVFEVDKEKAALSGLSTADIAAVLATSVQGHHVTSLHEPSEVSATPIEVRLPRADRSGIDRLLNLYVSAGSSGEPMAMIQLREIGQFVETTRDPTIYHKNLRPVAYVFGETAGRTPAAAILSMQGDVAPGTQGVPDTFEISWTGEGEWQITVDVFRDLGIAFAAACLGIYILLVYETSSYFMPVILMISIPLTIIGIMPGFWLLNLISGGPIGGYENPVFFTATAMIGMIALSGIAVRNAILLIDFIHSALDRNVSLKQAILDSGAVRFRPIFLTAGTAMLAAVPITLDPIFSGLAWALIFGLFVSTGFTLLLIPVVYWMIYQGRSDAQPE